MKEGATAGIIYTREQKMSSGGWTAERYCARFRSLDPVQRRACTAPPHRPRKKTTPKPIAASVLRLAAPPTLDGDHARFRVLSTQNDGNCFYHAVAAASNVDEWTARTVRAAVAHHFRTHGTRNRTEREALQRTETDGAWAHTEEVIAAAHALQRHVLVFEDVLDAWTSFGDENHLPLYLINRANVHFEGLAP